ncbi:MAG: hypothetical protein HN790_05365 [Methylococcales bacterium]|jgi:hypothetical protein|nr:hypothetical protein [Methylococcales bacterium]
MTTFIGILSREHISLANSILSENLNQGSQIWLGVRGVEINHVQHGKVALNSPVDISHTTSIPGTITSAFSHDWYNHIHVLPNQMALGNLVSEQKRTVEVFNAFDSPQTTTAILKKNTEGISVRDKVTQQPLTDKLTLAPFQSNLYQVAIDTSGPPVIDALFQFLFDPEQPRLSITGNRVVVFPFMANWDKTITQEYQWKTDVLQSYDGTEQRFKLRANPRQQFTFNTLTEGLETNRLDALLWNWQSRVFAVPLWVDAALLSKPVIANQAAIIVNTQHLNYQSEGLVVLINGQQVKALEIAQVKNNELELKRVLNEPWPIGTIVCPALLARLPAQQTVSRLTAGITQASWSFESDGNDDVQSETPVRINAIYRNHPVLTFQPNRSNPIDQQYLRLTSLLDNGVNTVTIDDHGKQPNIISSVELILENKAQIAEFKEWLKQCAGRHQSFWMPTWQADLHSLELMAKGSRNMIINNIGYAMHYQRQPGKQDVMILLRDGTRIYRHVTGAVISDSNSQKELLTFEKALSQPIQPKDILMLSFLGLCRLESDQVEFEWLTHDIARVGIKVRLLSSEGAYLTS